MDVTKLDRHLEHMDEETLLLFIKQHKDAFLRAKEADADRHMHLMQIGYWELWKRSGSNHKGPES